MGLISGIEWDFMGIQWDLMGIEWDMNRTVIYLRRRGLHRT